MEEDDFYYDEVEIDSLNITMGNYYIIIPQQIYFDWQDVMISTIVSEFQKERNEEFGNDIDYELDERSSRENHL